ncbi:MAG: DoxX family protein [Pseudomonadota bacterium]
MASRAERDPAWIDAILDWRGIWLIARLGLTSAYLLGGVTKLADFPAAIAEQERFGLHPGALWAAVTIAVELGGSALVLSGRLVWLGAGALAVLTAVASLVANDFWALQGQARFVAMNGFFEHIGLIAGIRPGRHDRPAGRTPAISPTSTHHHFWRAVPCLRSKPSR